MGTEEPTTAAETPPAADGSRWFYGCSIAVIALFSLGAHAVTEFEKSLDGDGQMEQPGRSGSAYQPLGPGATARYEDGLRVTVSPQRPTTTAPTASPLPTRTAPTRSSASTRPRTPRPSPSGPVRPTTRTRSATTSIG